MTLILQDRRKYIVPINLNEIIHKILKRNTKPIAQIWVFANKQNWQYFLRDNETYPTEKTSLQLDWNWQPIEYESKYFNHAPNYLDFDHFSRINRTCNYARIINVSDLEIIAH